jgi:prepilin signal peptidase PulO-like enzyme (type II secretory pathway)
MLPWSWFGVVIGLGIAILSRLGGGDVKVALTLGGLVGPLVMSSVFIFALGLSVTLLIGQRRGWHQWNVQRWPLVPFLVVPACAMVLLGVR